MPLNNPSQGEGYAPAYAISATPFVTSSTVTLGETKRIDFDFASRFVYVKNDAPATNVIAVGFTENGMKPANSNFFLLSGSQWFQADLRVNKLFVSGAAGTPTSFTVLAGLTFIPAKHMMTITGSAGFGGVG